MALPRAKKRSATVFSRDEIGVEQLQSLKEKFADGDLNEKEFVSLFREIVDASLSETQLTELFQKIDANSDGTVDWDELTNYMFLSGSANSEEFVGDDSNTCYETAHPEKYVSDTGPGSTGASSTSAGAEATGSALSLGLPAHHKDVITRVVRLERPSAYLTTSKDGSVRTWNAHSLAPQQVLASGRDWLTDCCVMKRSNRLVVSSMNRTLGFYDLGSNQLIGELVDYSRKQCIPLCVAYVEKPADDREAIVVGDDTGGISVLTCSDQWLACDGRSPPGNTAVVSSSSNASNASGGANGTLPGSGAGSNAPNSSSSASGGSATTTAGGNSSQNASSATTTNTGAPTAGGSGLGGGGANPAGSAALESQGFLSRVKFQKHTDWVTRVKWVHDMRAVVATSLDATVSILDVDRLVVKFEYTRHRKGVFDLAWCASTRLIASCGMERDIHIWNPYSSQRAVATLKGHTSSVLHLASDDDNFQLISAAADNTVKVWDVRNHRCLQTFVVDRHRGTTSASGPGALPHPGGSGAAASGANAGVAASLSAENRVPALLFDGKAPCLMTATTHLTRWPVKEAEGPDAQIDDDPDDSPAGALAAARKAKLRGGAPVERPLRLACYNSVFHQVVTAAMDAESAIKTWSAETGDEISSFARAHGASPVTAIAFDHAGRRLLTGAHDGERLKMWNFSNGALVKQFIKHEPPPLCSLLSTPSASSTTASTSALTEGLASSSSKGATDSVPVGPPSSPRKRKIRDIMLLPPSFGMDHEGRRGSPSTMATAELPSPTRARLLRGRDHPTPVPPTQIHRPEDAGGSAGKGSRGPRPRPHARTQASMNTRASRVSETSKYRQQEVTNILDIERNLRVGMGDFICQRFVCSVGWDRRLFVWADKNDESEALPVHVLPSDAEVEGETDSESSPGIRAVAEEDTEDAGASERLGRRGGRRRRRRQHHTMDVLALAYLPPAYVATAGLDGQVLLWSLNSGELVVQLHRSPGSIETLCYAEKLELLMAAGESGLLLCFDRSTATQAELPLETATRSPLEPEPASLEPVTALKCDKNNTHLVSGDAGGGVRVWELRIAADHEGVEIALVCTWHLGGGATAGGKGTGGRSLDGAARLSSSSRRVLAAEFVENLARVAELFLVLSCADGEVTLWTLDGVHVGSFGGRHRAWQLGRPTTYASKESRCEWDWLPARAAAARRRASSLAATGMTPLLQTREEMEAQAEDEDAALDDELEEEETEVDALTPCPTATFFVKCCSIVALNSSGSEPRESFLLEDTMPKPGEVWICVSGHRTRAATQSTTRKQDDGETGAGASDSASGSRSSGGSRRSVGLATVGNAAILSRRSSPFGTMGSSTEPRTLASLPYLKRRLADTAGEVTDLITVVKVTRGEIWCWDGAANKPMNALKVLDMSEFVRKAGWTKHLLLSQFVGRMFLDGETTFRVAAIAMRPVDQARPDKKAYTLVDSEAKERELQPLSEAVSATRCKLKAIGRAERQQHAAVSGVSAPRRRSTAIASRSSSVVGISGMQGLNLGDSALSALLAGSSPPGVSLGAAGAMSLEGGPTFKDDGNPAILSALALAGSVGMGARTLPLIRPREKRDMGGLLPKRSSVRNRLDPTADVRRIHNPDDIPKNFRAVLQHKREHKDAGFDGILPE